MYPAEPARPAAGAPITDAYVQALLTWGNRILGIATVDRTLWRGEHRCIGKMVDVGQVR